MLVAELIQKLQSASSDAEVCDSRGAPFEWFGVSADGAEIRLAAEDQIVLGSSATLTNLVLPPDSEGGETD